MSSVYKMTTLSREEIKAMIKEKAEIEATAKEIEKEAETRKQAQKAAAKEAITGLKADGLVLSVKDWSSDKISGLAGLYAPPAEALSQYEPLEFDNPADLLHTFSPSQTCYKWQAEINLQLAGYFDTKDLTARTLPTTKNPLYYNVCAANGSGKDAYIVAPFAVWFCCTKVRSRCIITSSSYNQLKSNTFEPIKKLCEAINQKAGELVFKIVEFYIVCNKTGSEIRCFVTDEAGKAEGFHPFSDQPGAELAFIANEAKTIQDDLFEAFERFTYNYWIEISSPGTNNGHFYRSCTRAVQYPAPLVLVNKTEGNGESDKIGYFRRITAYDCPHRSLTVIKRLMQEYGVNSLLFRSNVLAEFTSIDDKVIISRAYTEYRAPLHNTYGLPVRAGLDLSLGGDETVLSIWHGNKRLSQEVWRERNEPTLHKILIAAFEKHGLKPENIYADAGGIGKPIIDRLADAGWNVVRVSNEGRAHNRLEYMNRVAENWFRFKRLVEERILILPENDKQFIDQLTSRLYRYTKGRIALEEKHAAKSRGVESPDRADAAVLAFSMIPLSVFLGTEQVDREEKAQQEALADLNHRWKNLSLTFEDFSKMQELYGQRRSKQLEGQQKAEIEHPSIKKYSNKFTPRITYLSRN